MSETVTLWAECRRVWWPPEVGGIYPTEDAARAARDHPDPTGTDWRVVPWTVELPPAIAEVLRRARDWRALYDPGVGPEAYWAAERALVAAVDAAWPDGDSHG